MCDQDFQGDSILIFSIRFQLEPPSEMILKGLVFCAFWKGDLVQGGFLLTSEKETKESLKKKKITLGLTFLSPTFKRILLSSLDNSHRKNASSCKKYLSGALSWISPETSICHLYYKQYPTKVPVFVRTQGLCFLQERSRVVQRGDKLSLSVSWVTASFPPWKSKCSWVFFQC